MKVLKICFLVLLASMMAGCSSDTDDEVQESYTNDRIVGRWYAVSYLTSDNYFIPVDDGEFYEFTKDGVYHYYNGDVLQDTETGQYNFSPESNIIAAKAPGGWDFHINVTFTGENNATFAKTGKTPGQSMTIKVERRKDNQ